MNNTLKIIVASGLAILNFGSIFTSSVSAIRIEKVVKSDKKRVR